MKRVLILFGLVVMLSGAVAQANPAQTLAPTSDDDMAAACVAMMSGGGSRPKAAP